VAVFLVNEAVPWCRQYAIFTDKFDQLLKEAQIGTRENTYGSTQAEFLDENRTKVLRVFFLAVHSLALRFLFLQAHATSYSFLSQLLYTVKEKGGIPPYPMV
jgi:hypothetical protein